jgi:hypothetical protein
LGEWKEGPERHRETRNSKRESENKEKKVHQYQRRRNSRKKREAEILVLALFLFCFLPSVLFAVPGFAIRVSSSAMFSKTLTFPHISSHRFPDQTLRTLGIAGFQGMTEGAARKTIRSQNGVFPEENDPNEQRKAGDVRDLAVFDKSSMNRDCTAL